MKRVIIAGAGSYIGEHIAQCLLDCPQEYQVDVVDLLQEGWQNRITGCDTVVQVAGIAHVRETEDVIPLYYKVNRDIAYETAKLAKQNGAGQFIYMSSMSVYGKEQGEINADTPLVPTTHYGKSKAAAEALLQTLADAHFHIAVLRPPMVYGKGCRGNYPRLSRLALRVPVFPKLDQQRSMVYIGNLCEAIRMIIDSGDGGLYFPQDAQYHNVPAMMQRIAGEHGRKLLLIPGFQGVLSLLAGKNRLFGKVFGSLTYDRSLPGAPGAYQLFTNDEAVHMTETEGQQ